MKAVSQFTFRARKVIGTFEKRAPERPREMQFLGNTAQKRGNSEQKEVTNQAFWLVNEQRNSAITNEMRALVLRDMGALLLLNDIAMFLVTSSIVIIMPTRT